MTYHLNGPYQHYFISLTAKAVFLVMLGTSSYEFVGAKYIGNRLKSLFLAGNELVPSMTKYTASGHAHDFTTLDRDIVRCSSNKMI